MHHHLTRAAALCLLLALSGCGGGSDSPAPAPTPAPAPAPTPAPAPQPPAPPAADRIEPFDPAALSKAGARESVPAITSTIVPLAPVSATITLSALATGKSAGTAPAGAPLQIGQGRTVNDTSTTEQTTALLRWQPGEDGSQVAALRFVATGAQGLRLGVRVQALPAGARLYFQGSQGQAHAIDAAQLRALMQRNLDGGANTSTASLYWSPEVAGEQVTLVIEIPAQADVNAVRLSVPLLSHITITPQQASQLAKAGAGSCEIDVACSADALEQGRSVARLRFVKSDGYTYQCTGTLMNDTANSGTPYVLTAHHCVDDQTTASTLTTDWLLRAATCGSSSIDPAHAQRTGGATLLYTSTAADTTLVRLADSVPAGVVYAGSYFGPDAVPGTAISDVHHPEGDLQKISLGKLSGYSICANNQCLSADRSTGTFYSVQWQQGVVEPGSSGSGAFMTLGQRHYLIGQLYGGTSSCTNPNGPDFFARFDLTYADALHQWLKP
ncbi:MAG: hypothetical protein ABT03_12850 [Comamonas sp. SCN 67-35]|uniref:trypsin-like serine peptidase n=1 Tax=unclassified Comamonas TaxID=2638500 RepID=UPI00086CA7F1|nr:MULTISPECIES: trypsin-like peptidase domain-containing protein [unclassified Comamonas]MBN9331382.1 trypsin-like peptidase domain-containing protein [Comamonas sp.]ODU37434.1 MAG: hypothetical protein ABT03_12850 [Comamonas sp. SCN 67-35]OJX02270.1 MAG: hypothetical protein BGO73_00640 [Burkholderiales bacterium 66-26]